VLQECLGEQSELALGMEICAVEEHTSKLYINEILSEEKRDSIS
jgi:DNA-binding transcriptional ArsR family regulator